MRYRVLPMIALCSACASAPEAERMTTTSATERSAPAPGTNAPASVRPGTDGLSDLGAMTFRCPQAGLNAAAREAAKVASQGRYQFAYYRLINDSHHSSYEIRFKSNVEGEADLKYCVSVYCQQGQDPNAGLTVSSISNEPRATKARSAAPAHGSACGDLQASMKRRSKR